MAASLLSHKHSLALVKKPGDLRIINIGSGHHCKASANVSRNWIVSDVGEGRDVTEISNFGGMLGDGQCERAILELRHDRLRCIETGDFDFAGLTRLSDAVGSARSREEVGTENTSQ